MTIPQKISAAILSVLTILSIAGTPAMGEAEYNTADPSLPTVSLGIETAAGSAVLLDASGDTARVLWEHNADEKRGPASTTKIMTALVAAEQMPLSSEITVAADAVGIEGSSVYLREGEVLTLEELLYCTLLESANDAATAIAIAVSGSVEAFAELMNEKCREIGLSSTHFTNPHGLDDTEHYTTARELGMIAAEALKSDALRKIFSTYKTTVRAPDGGTRYLINHNRLLRSVEGCIGVKTGYTKANGRCLVSAAERDGLRLIAVTLRDGNDWHDHTEMLEAGFDAYTRVDLRALAENALLPSVPVMDGEQSAVMTAVSESLSVTLPKNADEVVFRIETCSSLSAPVFAGDTAGTLTFYSGGKLIATAELTAAYAAAKKKEKGFWGRIFNN